MRGHLAIVSAACAAVVSCFRPSPPAGAPCTAEGRCPTPLVCEPSTSTCEAPDYDGPMEAGAVDADPDAFVLPDAPVRDCWPSWRADDIQVSQRVRLTQAATSDQDYDPSLSRDDLTLYLARADRMFTTSAAFELRRGSRFVAFTEPAMASALAGFVSRISPRADGRELVFASARSGGMGKSDLWRVDRTSSGNLGPPTQSHLHALDTADHEYDPELSVSGLHLYFARVIANGGQMLLVANRATDGADFEPAVAVDVPAPRAVMADPVVSPDETVLLFSSGSVGGDTDVYYASRATLADAWTLHGKVHELGLNGIWEGDPTVTADGCQVFFSSTPDAQSVPRDVYSVEVLP